MNTGNRILCKEYKKYCTKDYIPDSGGYIPERGGYIPEPGGYIPEFL